MPITTRRTRYTLGCIIMVSHFAAIAVFLIFGMRHMALADVLQGITTVAPLGAVYVGAFVSYVTVYPNEAPDEVGTTVSPEAFYVQLFLVGLFALALVAAPAIIFIFGPTGDVQDATTYAGVIDTLFAGYIAAIFKKLFPFSDKTQGPVESPIKDPH